MPGHSPLERGYEQSGVEQRLEYVDAYLVTNSDGSQVWEFNEPDPFEGYLYPPSEPSIQDYFVELGTAETIYLLDAVDEPYSSIIEVNDSILSPKHTLKVVDTAYYEHFDLRRFALAKDLRGGPDYGGGGGGGPGDNLRVTLPEDFEDNSLAAYEGDGVRGTDAANGNIFSGEDVLQGQYALSLPRLGQIMYDNDSPNLVQKGNYYSFLFTQLHPTLDSNDEGISQFFFGMATGGGANGQSFILELPYNLKPRLIYRNEIGSRTDITSSVSGSLGDIDVKYDVVIKWDDGTLGGTDGDIEVTIYNRFTGNVDATLSSSSTAISSGTIGWGAPSDNYPGTVDYLRNKQYQPRDRKGSVLESFESGDLLNYSGRTNDFKVVNDYRATDGDYMLKTTGPFSFIYRGDLTNPTSKGHFYNFDTWQVNNDSSIQPDGYRFYFGLDSQGGVISGKSFEVSVSHDGEILLVYDDGNGSRTNFVDVSSGSSAPMNEHVNVQLWWDDGTLGGSDGEIGVEVFDKFTGDRHMYAIGDTSIFSGSLPSSGTYGWASNVLQDNNVEPVLIDDLREATKPTFTSQDTPPGK